MAYTMKTLNKEFRENMVKTSTKISEICPYRKFGKRMASLEKDVSYPGRYKWDGRTQY
jgi:hypothetical protein